MNLTPASIAVCNQKGGVGKSTFTVLLASYLHYTLRHNVLVVDCDYQSSDMRVVESIARWVASRAQKASFSDGSVQQNAGDGNPQGSPLGRFAWPCGFSSPAFNSLPAERDYGIVSRIAPAYCAILKTLSSFSLNAAISCPILSLVIRA